MSQTSASRTITYYRPPQDGKPAVGIICTQPKISYSRLYDSTTEVYIQVNEGSVIVKPTITSIGITWADQPSYTPSLVANQSYGGMKVTYGFQGNVLVFTFKFDQGADFKGTIKVRMSHNGTTFLQTIDVCPEAVPVGVECDLLSLTYKRVYPYTAVKFNAALVIDGVRTVPTSYAGYYQDQSGDDIQILYAPGFHQGFNFTHDGFGTFQILILETATFQGTIHLQLVCGDISRYVSIPVVRLEDGRDATRIDCTIAGITYNASREVSSFRFKADLIIDGVKADAADVTRSGYIQDDEGTQSGMGLSVFKGAIFGYNAEDDTYLMVFTQGAEFEGEIYLTLSKGDVSRTIQIPICRVVNGNDGRGLITLEASTNTIVYNSDYEYSRSISFVISDNGEIVIPASLSVRFNDVAVTSGNTIQGMKVTWGGRNTSMIMDLEFGVDDEAEAEGVLEVEATYNGQAYKTEISVTRVRDGEKGEDGIDAVNLICTSNSVTYNPARQNTFGIGIRIKDGERFFPPTFVSASFTQSGETTPQTIANNAVIGGMTFAITEVPLEEKQQLTLAFAVNASASGALQLNFSYNGKAYTADISVTRVENGIKGVKGATPRGPRVWSDVKSLHEDSSDPEKFYSGKGDEERIDIVMDENQYFVPEQTHTVYSSVKPTQDNHGTYWKVMTDFEFVATKLLYAERAKVDNLVSDGIEMDDENGHPCFSVSKYDDGQGHQQAVVWANRGKFENVSVLGDIKVNTQQYFLPPFPSEDIRLWQPNREKNPNAAISIIPKGGCLIIPTGKCPYEIVLPDIPAPASELDDEMARQITLVNQHLPMKNEQSSVAIPDPRKCYIRPGSSNVVLFTSLSSLSKNKVVKFGEPCVTLGYGVYMLYGYRAELPTNFNDDSDDDDLELQHQTYTCWTLWCSSNTATEINKPLTGVTYPVAGSHTLQMYNNNITAI